MPTKEEPYWRSPLEFSADQIASAAAIEALTQCFDEMGIWADPPRSGDNDIQITVKSFDMPEEEGKPSDIWHKKFSLFEAIKEHVEIHCDADDKEELARIFEQMAAEIRALPA